MGSALIFKNCYINENNNIILSQRILRGKLVPSSNFLQIYTQGSFGFTENLIRGRNSKNQAFLLCIII